MRQPPFCRKHHNLHTHGGWETEQLADGTLILTSPDGRDYRIAPLGPIPLIVDQTDLVPKKQPRAAQRAERVRREREEQHTENAVPPDF